MSTTAGKKYPQVGQRGTGRRKQAIARVRVKTGSGLFFVNGRLIDQYFDGRQALVYEAKQPLAAADLGTRYDVLVKVEGGGKSGQAGAVKLGLARALSELNGDFETVMRAEGLMTRDARVKERKKYGLKRARKAFQFSKR
ncbi:MAG: 30S ribosomal protein S9 [Vampirovibrionales bacterium]|jgi:small subunit ribosomal protein S9|nr:30S ribosomal protein S9 [Vampirovibrionales bacterium]